MKIVFALAALALVAAPALAHLETQGLDGETYYVPVNPVDDHGVYQETNDCDGLQESESDCILEPVGEPVVLEPADERVLL